MTVSTLIDIDQDTLVVRRRRAAERGSREAARQAFLADIMQAERQAADLRRWIETATVSSSDHPEYRRLIDWAKAKLQLLELCSQPEAVSAVLRERSLFPQPEPLADPLGEPPARHVWGR